MLVIILLIFVGPVVASAKIYEVLKASPEEDVDRKWLLIDLLLSLLVLAMGMGTLAYLLHWFFTLR